MDLLLTDEEINEAWPDDINITTSILTETDMVNELIRCARIICQAQLAKVLNASLDDEKLREEIAEVINLVVGGSNKWQSNTKK